MHKGEGGKVCQFPEDFLGRGFKGSVREETTGCLSSLCSVLGLVGMEVKFGASSTFRFHAVWGLCACSQQFSSGGLLPAKTP